MSNIITRVLNYCRGDRIHPSLLNPQWATYLSLNSAITNFANDYVKGWASMLDFWCWKMIYKPFFIKHWVWKYTWIDIWDSPEFSNDYIVYSWWVIPAQDNEFDITFSTQVFEHLEDPVFYGHELERVTKKDWFIFISIAHVWEYHAYPKHYYNVFLDAIPLMFPNSQIITVQADTTNIQNSFQMLTGAILKKNFVAWVLMAFFVNTLNYIFHKLWIFRVEPTNYQGNSMTWNILITLQVTNK